MPSKEPDQYLEDVLENIEKARAFAEGMSREEFLGDEKTVYAVVRALEIISEASRSIPAEIKHRHPEVDWRVVAGAGNVYRHNYPAVDNERVWATVHGALDLLEQVVGEELERLAEQEPESNR